MSKKKRLIEEKGHRIRKTADAVKKRYMLQEKRKIQKEDLKAGIQEPELKGGSWLRAPFGPGLSIGETPTNCPICFIPICLG